MYSITRNYDNKGKCIRCPECKSTDIDLQITFTDEGHLAEADQYCKNCLTKVGYYSYGCYEPCFSFNDKSLPALYERIICKINGVSTP